MKSVIFETPGLLDFKALTTFGMSAKPNTDSPIGFFGTGLNNAIAVLVRLDIPVTMWIGEAAYIFQKEAVKFRGKPFDMIICRKRHRAEFLGNLPWTKIELPFTTELGKHWELWQAFRELEANTRDEGGTTFALTDVSSQTLLDMGKAEHTRIVVGGDAFHEVYENRDSIFLPQDDLVLIAKSPGVTVYRKPSQYLYYRGLRVLTLDKPSMYTYNLTAQMQLTEDRTLAGTGLAQAYIASWVATDAPHDVVAQVINADREKFFEGKLDFDYVWSTPSEAFSEVVSKQHRRRGVVPESVRHYYSRYVVPEEPDDAVARLSDQLSDWLANTDKELNADEELMFDQILDALRKFDC